MKIPTDWTFKSTEVSQHFETHVREQLPWYDLAAGMVAHLARHYIPKDGLVFDVGASTGNFGRIIAEALEARSARLIAVDDSQAMLDVYNGPGETLCADATTVDYSGADVIVSFLMLMFVPCHARRALLQRWFDALRTGGALIIVDKDQAPPGYLGTAVRRLTLAGKVAAGVAANDIINKELSLSGVQRPLSRTFVPWVIPHAVEVFRFGEFVGYVAEKD